MILQEHYGNIEIDNTEKDIVQIWNKNDVIQIERENLSKLILLLTIINNSVQK